MDGSGLVNSESVPPDVLTAPFVAAARIAQVSQ